ncbi:Bgt-622-2 [Blumeria graminis f. sp. tritici]|uniref:Bgt-622-2 n=2 Tax=Blumeria graminis f. sp. tritici TaxID=62690 RepID=A0A9X9QDQ7_BLUGR|nr:Bgt-622-2 [Blumeria graminis f. sp. tritici]
MWKRLSGVRSSSHSSHDKPVEALEARAHHNFQENSVARRKFLPTHRNSSTFSTFSGFSYPPFESSSHKVLLEQAAPFHCDSEGEIYLPPVSHRLPFLTTPEHHLYQDTNSARLSDIEISPLSSPDLREWHLRRQSGVDEEVSPIDETADSILCQDRKVNENIKTYSCTSAACGDKPQKKNYSLTNTALSNKASSDDKLDQVVILSQVTGREKTNSPELKKNKPKKLIMPFGVVLRSVHENKDEKAGTPTVTSFGKRLRKLKPPIIRERSEQKNVANNTLSSTTKTVDNHDTHPAKHLTKSRYIEGLSSPEARITPEIDDYKKLANECPTLIDVTAQPSFEGPANYETIEVSNLQANGDSKIGSVPEPAVSDVDIDSVMDGSQTPTGSPDLSTPVTPLSIDVNLKPSLSPAHTHTTITERKSLQQPEASKLSNFEKKDAHFVPSPSLDKITHTPEEIQVQSLTLHGVRDEQPHETNASTQHEQSLINRKQPQGIAPTSNRIVRKALPPNSPIFINMATSTALGANKNLFHSKNLPQTPREHSSNDLVGSLQAHLEDLAHRRWNISRSIRQMTQLMPKDTLLGTEEVRQRREREKRKVEMLMMEEADLKREEHQVGLRLHRAWKRKDLDAVYEPTSLWVRRVTG